MTQAKLTAAQLSWTGDSDGGYGRTNLQQADLSGADLITSYLRGADFTEANLSQANL
ncbi:MAG: pentapeptide repeat-containing protein [Leptolyngbyaceae cyanobacterium RM2_2_4]|nr:pentapeptide repeat-containing protein [Leptolyngbyaceae cyanobacterium SM1_4_3]NJN90241.1 pentapeptide repeat-containing protein [Leptolyngbyaceae cyanobacterium SL_5_14]NJO50530.1 pentapeptide repeat-containing protein [Leptolyngbyaceae cyanobacterium RM2_2_4]